MDNRLKALKEVIERMNIRFPVAEIARETGFSKGQVSSILNEKIPMSDAFFNSFNKKFNNSSKNETYTEHRRNLKNTTNKTDVPMYSGYTTLGNIEVIDDENVKHRVMAHLPAEVFPGCDYAEKAQGDSMHPVIQNQAILAGKTCPVKGIVFGEKYIIKTKHGLDTTKYVHPCTDETKFCLKAYNKSMIRAVERAAKELNYHWLPVREIRRKHIKAILEHLNKSDDRFNKFRTALLSLFTELVEMEVTELNPVKDLRKKKVTRKPKEVLTQKEREKIDEYLKAHCYNLWRFVHIFFHSGQRETELLSLQAKDIDLNKQEYPVLIKKGKQQHWQLRTIKDIALPFWVELLATAKPDDYIFSKNLQPGATQSRPDTATKIWRRWVKVKLCINKDLYSLKHLHTTEIVDALGNRAAALHDGHLSTEMVDKIYDVRSKKRLQDAVKEIKTIKLA